jgi:hypothetical protein
MVNIVTLGLEGLREEHGIAGVFENCPEKTRLEEVTGLKKLAH